MMHRIDPCNNFGKKRRRWSSSSSKANHPHDVSKADIAMKSVQPTLHLQCSPNRVSSYETRLSRLTLLRLGAARMFVAE